MGHTQMHIQILMKNCILVFTFDRTRSTEILSLCWESRMVIPRIIHQRTGGIPSHQGTRHGQVFYWQTEVTIRFFPTAQKTQWNPGKAMDPEPLTNPSLANITSNMTASSSVCHRVSSTSGLFRSHLRFKRVGKNEPVYMADASISTFAGKFTVSEQIGWNGTGRRGVSRPRTFTPVITVGEWTKFREKCLSPSPNKRG